MLYEVSNNFSKCEQLEPTNLKKLGKQEKDFEELLRLNADIIWDEEETLMIVGQQVTNTAGGRTDLIAVDNEGNLVLIEIKRDKEDIVHRKEAFEFQAIRYAASLAAIQDEDEFILKIFAPYVEKHAAEFSDFPSGRDTADYARRKLHDFFQQNNIKAFNQKQRIILFASDYDEQTLSAVAWLCSNHLDISCCRALPYQQGDKVLLEIEQILPLDDYEDYYVSIRDTEPSAGRRERASGRTRQNLPKIDELLANGVVHENDILHAKGKSDETATLRADGTVVTKEGKVLSMQIWLKQVFGWSAVQTFAYAVHEPTGKTLFDLRAEYMRKKEAEQSAESV